MAVLCEGISVIVRRDSIDLRLESGWDAFKALVPNATLCCDEELARVGFMDPDGAGAFVRMLEAHGLVFWGNDSGSYEANEDIAVIDQLRGLTRPCEWLEFGRFPMGKNPRDKVSACWLFEGVRIVPGLMHVTDSASAMHVPANWTYEGSLSHKFTSVDDLQLDDRLELLRMEEGGLKAYRDRDSGKGLYLGSPIVATPIRN